MFFNWLPALLADQSDASQPAHEIMQYLDDPANYFGDRQALATKLSELGNATELYRQNADMRPGDEPILEAIDVYIEQARSFLAGNVQFSEPHLDVVPLRRDQG